MLAVSPPFLGLTTHLASGGVRPGTPVDSFTKVGSLARSRVSQPSDAKLSTKQTVYLSSQARTRSVVDSAKRGSRVSAANLSATLP